MTSNPSTGTSNKVKQRFRHFFIGDGISCIGINIEATPNHTAGPSIGGIGLVAFDIGTDGCSEQQTNLDAQGIEPVGSRSGKGYRHPSVWGKPGGP